VQIPSEGTGFRFELLVKTSRHDKGRTVSLLTQSNTKLHEWVRAIKETLYIYHLKTGGEEGERKAKAMGVAPESLWEEWNYSFEKPSTPEETAMDIAAEERAAAELRRLGASSPSQESASSSSSSDSDTTHKRSTSDPIPTVTTLTLDPTIPYGTTSGLHSTPAPAISPPSSRSPSSPPIKGTNVYFPETTSSTTSPPRASQQPKNVRTIGEEVPSLDSPHSMLPSLRASLMQRKVWSGSSNSNLTGARNSSSSNSSSESRSTSTTS